MRGALVLLVLVACADTSVVTGPQTWGVWFQKDADFLAPETTVAHLAGHFDGLAIDFVIVDEEGWKDGDGVVCVYGDRRQRLGIAGRARIGRAHICGHHAGVPLGVFVDWLRYAPNAEWIASLTLAHEIGHGFGLRHNTTGGIMFPEVGVGTGWTDREFRRLEAILGPR